jgi:hypothetical protein
VSRGSKIVPYVIVLAIVSYLYFLATKIDFVAPGGRIGPDVWPKEKYRCSRWSPCEFEIVKTCCPAGPAAISKACWQRAEGSAEAVPRTGNGVVSASVVGRDRDDDSYVVLIEAGVLSLHGDLSPRSCGSGATGASASSSPRA